MKKAKKPKLKRYTVTLNEVEMRRLNHYAASFGIDRPLALHRIVRQSLRAFASNMGSPEVHDANQLGLFDSVQIDIFANTSMANS